MALVRVHLRIGDKLKNFEIIGEPIRFDSKLYVPVRCVCGTEKIVYKGNLTNTKNTLHSCGCLKRGDIQKSSIRKSIYGRWKQMHHRCSNMFNPQYKDYGARGIVMCQDWDVFENFYSWAIENGFRKEYLIDRIDVELGYMPENCRWVNRTISARNTRTAVKLAAFGETKTLYEWLEDPRCKVGRATLDVRIRNNKPFYKYWSNEDKLTTPPKNKK